MGSELIQAVLMLAGAGAVGSAIFLFVQHWWRMRLQAWERAVRQAGLRDVEVHDHVFNRRVSARDDGLEVRLEPYRRGKHESGTRLTIRRTTARHGALTIRGEGLGTALDKALTGARELEVGDAAFDGDCFVQGPPAVAMATLTPPVRRALAQLLRGSVEGESGRRVPVRASLKDGVLKVERRRVPFAADDVPDLLAGALRIARGLLPPDDLAARLVDNLRAEKDAGVRVRLVETLAREFPSHPRRRQALLDACADENDEVRLQAAVATPVEGRRTLLALVSGESASDSVRARAVAALGREIPPELLEETLRRALSARAPATARACVEALQELRRAESEPLLLQALEARDEHVSLAAARALRVCGTIAAVPRLLDVAQGASANELRQAARAAVGAIQSRVPGAAPGQLTLADGASGGLSLVEETPSGQLSLADAGQPTGLDESASGREPTPPPRPRGLERG